MLQLLTRSSLRRLPLSLFGSLVAYGVLTCQLARQVHAQGAGMFTDRSSLIPFSTRQLNYGVAVSDVDNDGELEWIVAGFDGPNMVLKYDRRTGTYYNLAETENYTALQDPDGAAIGVCACDIDGDGREEIYFLNTNNRYSGPKTYKDKLFKWRNGRYEDLFSDRVNDGVSNMFAGRSVAAVDRFGNGIYSIIVASYAQYGQGSFGLIEMDAARSDVNSGRIALANVAGEAGIDLSTGGRGITVGPILGNDGASDIFFDNEGGSRGNDGRNALFSNNRDGTFTNVASRMGLDDERPGRGVALADFNNDGRIDIVYGNWMSPHRLFLQRNGYFEDVLLRRDDPNQEMANPSPVRTVIAADFDNDGVLEVFFNNIVYSWGGDRSMWQNRLFKVTPSGSSDVTITKLNVGDALEPNGYGTGGAVSDIDGDGQLELLLSHGESSRQELSLYHVTQGSNNHWLRIAPLTRHCAPARGAKVTVTLSDGTRLTRVIDGGSGYLCQMEPVAHFGLGRNSAIRVSVQWPDGRELEQSLGPRDQDKLHTFPHPNAPGRCEGRGPGPSAGAGAGAGQDGRYSVGVGGPNSRGQTGGVGGRQPATTVTMAPTVSRCRTQRVTNYIRDPATGCYTSRPVRHRVCQGTCRRRGSCCQPMAERYRRMVFACSNGARYRKVAKAGVRRCQCATCPA